MALVLVTGGTTGAADGTAVSQSGSRTAPFELSLTAADAHVRCETDTYSADQTFTVPAEVEVSFDGGSNWVGSGAPRACPEVGDLNFPIKMKQVSVASTAASTFTTDGTFPACTALTAVSDLAGVSGMLSVVLTWSAVTNATYIKVERASDSGFTTGLTTLTQTLAGNSTTYTATGLSTHTTYYFRVTGIGTGQYSNSTVSNTATVEVTMVDEFEIGTNGNTLTTPWTVSQATAQYTNAQYKVGAQSAFIEGTTAAAYGYARENVSAGMTADGCEVVWWQRFDSANEMRQVIPRVGTGWLIVFNNSGVITIYTTQSVEGYPQNNYTAIGTYAADTWMQYRLKLTFSTNSYTFSQRASTGDSWTQLKSTGAPTYNIPLYTTGLASVTGVQFNSYYQAGMWIDDVRASSTGGL